MADVKIVKSIYTSTDVTSLGEVAADDTVAIPCPVSVTGALTSGPTTINQAAYAYSQGINILSANATEGFFAGVLAANTPFIQGSTGGGWGNLYAQLNGGNLVVGATAASTGAKLEVVGSISGVDITSSGQATLKEVKDTTFTITPTANFDVDPANGCLQKITVNASGTPTFANFEEGQIVMLSLSGGSSYTITWTTTWIKPGGGGIAPSPLAATGAQRILLWMEGTTMYSSDLGKQ